MTARTVATLLGLARGAVCLSDGRDNRRTGKPTARWFGAMHAPCSPCTQSVDPVFLTASMLGPSTSARGTPASASRPAHSAWPGSRQRLRVADVRTAPPTARSRGPARTRNRNSGKSRPAHSAGTAPPRYRTARTCPPALLIKNRKCPSKAWLSMTPVTETPDEWHERPCIRGQPGWHRRTPACQWQDVVPVIGRRPSGVPGTWLIKSDVNLAALPTEAGRPKRLLVHPALSQSLHPRHIIRLSGRWPAFG